MKNFCVILCLCFLSNLNAQNINNEHVDSLYHENKNIIFNDTTYRFKIVNSEIEAIITSDSSFIDDSGTINFNYSTIYTNSIKIDTIMYVVKTFFSGYKIKLGYIQTEKRFLTGNYYALLDNISVKFYNRKFKLISTPKVYWYLSPYILKIH